MSWSTVRQAAFCGARVLPISLLVAAITAACVSLVLFSLTFAALTSDQTVYLERIQQAFRDGTLPDGRVDSYAAFQAHINNECVSLSSVIVPYPSRLEGALSVQVTTPIVPPCQSLRAYVSDPGSDIEVLRYDRYLHGWRVLWLTTLPTLTVFQVFQFTFWIGLATLFSLIVVGAWRTVSVFAHPWPRDHWEGYEGNLWRARIECSSVVMIGLSFLLCFGWFSFGLRPTHAVWGIVVFVFLLVASTARLEHWSLARLTAFCAGFGALLAWVDFLLGAPALGLSVVIGILALKQMDLEASAYVARLTSAAVAFMVGFVVPFFIKLALVSLLVDPSAAMDFFDQLLFRMAGNTGGSAGGLPEGVVERALAFGLDLRGEDVLGLKMLAFMGGKLVHGMAYSVGSVGVVGGILASTFLAGCFGAARALWISSDRRVRRLVVVLLVSVLVIVAWFLIFRQHTIVHTRFVSKLLVWPVAIGYVIGLIGVLDWLKLKRDVTITKPKLS